MRSLTVPSPAEPVPAARGSWLLGLVREFQRDQLGTLHRSMIEHGDVVRLVVGPPGLRRSLFLVTHPDGVQRVLAGGSDGYTKDTPFYEEIAASVGNGLLTSDGAVWRQQRRTLAPLFTHRRIARYVDMMADEARRLTARWHTEVDLHEEMTGYTLAVVGRVLFGAHVDEALPVIRATFPGLNRYVRRRGVAPIKVPRAWPTPANRRAATDQRAIYTIVDRIIESRRAANDDSEDLVTLLLAATDPETGQPLSTQEIRDQVIIFLLAGHETTSTALTFALHLLGHHPDVQDRVRREVDEVLDGRPVTAEDVGRLTYTTMVLKEAMRLYPPAFAVGRFAPAGDVIGGHRIPPRSIVVVSPWATHRHPEFWPDPERFDPDRFAPAAVAAHHRYAYLPFSGGPRACIGNHFATTEGVVALATIVGAFTLRTDSTPVPLDTGITLRPATPVRCTLL